MTKKELPVVGGQCVKCGRDFRGDAHYDDGKRHKCPSDDCPSNDKLSNAAKKLYRRMLKGDYIAVTFDDKTTPKAIAELEAADLIGVCGRVVKSRLCYVPRGFEGYDRESFKNCVRPDWVNDKE
jgi:hypothetical protein